MHDADTLYMFAQVSVAFAGFAGLMAFVRARTEEAVALILRGRLEGMVAIALVSTAFSILPVVVFAQGISEVMAWRTSALLFAVAYAPITFVTWRRAIAAKNVGILSVAQLTPYIATIGLISVVGSAVLQRYSSGLYLLGLFLILLVSGTLFLMLVTTLLDDPRE